MQFRSLEDIGGILFYLFPLSLPLSQCLRRQIWELIFCHSCTLTLREWTFLNKGEQILLSQPAGNDSFPTLFFSHWIQEPFSDS